jgi:transcriptional regulator with XRE-family HTH domain
MQNISERLRKIRLDKEKSQLEMAEYVGIPQRTWSNYENGKTEIPIRVILKLERLGYPIDWIIKGEDNENPEYLVNKVAITFNKSNLKNSENFGNVTLTPSGETPESLPVVPPEELPQPEHQVRAMTVFEIPLLTKEQALRLDPGKEIPCPTAYSGDYPDYTLVPIPLRLREYGTDLRAIVVFNGLMNPLLCPGDVAVFHVTGWSGDGVYLYRMRGELYISHVKSSGATYRLTKEFRAEEELPYDGGTFEAIGRVRAVVREIA